MIITIITSMRFKEELLEQTKKLSLEGHIVLSPVICSEFEGNEHHGELMQLHRKKLKMCDRAFVLNVDGYIANIINKQEFVNVTKI